MTLSISRRYIKAPALIFYLLLFLAVWFAPEGGKMAGVDLDTAVSGREFVWGPFYSTSLYGKFDRKDIFSAICFIWFFFAVGHYGLMRLLNLNFITKLFAFRWIFILPFASALALIYTSVSIQQIIRTFILELLPLILFVFAWLSYVKGHVSINDVLKFIKYLLIAVSINILFFIALNSIEIISMAGRKEVINGHYSHLMPLLFSICYLDLYVSKKNKMFSINTLGIILSVLVAIFSLKRVLWVEIIATMTVLFIFTTSIFSLKGLKNIAYIVVISFVLYTGLSYGVNRIYGGTMAGVVERLYSITTFINPSKQLTGYSEFGNPNSLSGHDLVLRDTFENIMRKPILGHGNQKMEEVIKIKHSFIALFGGTAGSHAGHLFIWFKEGILGFLIYLSFYVYLGITGFKSFRRTKNKNGLLLLVMIIVVFLQGITWQTIFIFPSDLIVYMFLFAGLLHSIQRYSSYEGFNNNILTFQQ